MKKMLLPVILILFGLSLAVFSQGLKQDENYLNQIPPITKPELFAKGIVSTKDLEHSSPVFSPLFDQVFWSVRVDGEYGKEIIRTAIRKGGKWSAPSIPSFSMWGKGDLYPTFSNGGEEIYFTSDRPDPADKKTVVRYIWKVSKKGKGWSEPEIVGFPSLDIYGLSVAENGTLYFMAQPVNDRDGSSYDIYSARLQDGKYLTPEKLGAPISTGAYEDGPFISKDEKFLIFESSRPGGHGKLDLYISKRSDKGKWSEPQNLGNVINSEGSERFPSISPDGKYFFFGSSRSGTFDTYWISASVIYDLID